MNSGKGKFWKMLPKHKRLQQSDFSFQTACTANQQCICHLKEDVRALEICLNFYNKDPILNSKETSIGAEQGGSHRGSKFVRLATAPGWLSLGSPQVCTLLQNVIEAILLSCFVLSKIQSPVPSRI